MIGNALIWRRVPSWGILALIAVLLLARLSDRLLWGDEAETALLARNILRFGLPRISDGVNVVTLQGAAIDANADGVWTWSPWLDEYLVAASFLIFGESTWSARFPCALVGLLCIPLLGGWFWRRYANVQAVWMGMLALGLMELFLLHSRQARYYSTVVLGQILLLHGLLDFQERRSRGKWVVAGAFLLQFYCNYIVCVANLPALVLTALCCRKRIRFLDLVYALALAALGTLPWVLYAQPWRQSQRLAEDGYWLKVVFYIQEIHFHMLPLFFLLWPLFGWRGQRHRQPDRSSLSAASPGAIPIAGTQVASSGFPDPLLAGFLFYFVTFVLIPPLAPGQFLRYLLPLFPMTAIWMVECLWSLRSRSWRKWALFLVLILTNIPAWLTASPFNHEHPVRIELTDFIDELTHRYTNRAEVMIDWFNAHSQPGDVVGLNDPEFPLIFYTRLRVIDLRFADKATQQISRDWVLHETACGITEPSDIPPPQWIPGYERITVKVPATRRVGSLPESDLREYRTTQRLSDFSFFRRLR